MNQERSSLAGIFLPADVSHLRKYTFFLKKDTVIFHLEDTAKTKSTAYAMTFNQKHLSFDFQVCVSIRNCDGDRHIGDER